MGNRVFGDLHQHHISGGQCQFNLAGFSTQPSRSPVHLTGIKDSVTATSNINEGGFHAGENILHAAQIDIAHHGCL